MTAVSVVGLGKLGACLLAVLSTRYDVVGVDTNYVTVRQLNDGQAPVPEPGLQELLDRNRLRYRVATDPLEIRGTDVTFVVVPTPSDADGGFSTKLVEDAMMSVGKAIRTRTDRHVVVIVSTVMPGATLGPIAKTLTGWCGRDIGPQLGLVYSPEFIALGNVIEGMTQPDMLLIGASDHEASDQVEQILTNITVKQPPVARLTVTEAELVKLLVNAYVTTKISYANTIAELCEGIPNVDARRVAAAVGLDSRIGGKYLQPATKFAGPCFPRDQRALIHLAHQLHAVAPITEATMDINDRQTDRLANIVDAVINEGETVGILGMAYKPDTPVLDESIGTALADVLADRGYRLKVHDPLATVEALRERLPGRIADIATDPVDLLTSVDVIVVAQPCDEYRHLARLLHGRTVIDVWDMFQNPTFLRPGVYRWGRNG